jgi:glutamate-1-semialdehyde 2,1-aminomutase
MLIKEDNPFLSEYPQSKDLYERACFHWQGGVPLLWIIRWAGKFPVFVIEA